MTAEWATAAISIFLIGNALPIAPIFATALLERPPPERRAFVARSVLTGTSVAVALAWGGGMLFRALGLMVADLRVAGGLILFAFAAYDLLFSRQERKTRESDRVEELDDGDHDESIVPLGIPILVGPATLATTMAFAQIHGALPVTGMVVALGVFNAGVLLVAPRLTERLGPGGLRAIGKVMALLLAAIAVSMVRVGITEMLTLSPTTA